MTPAATLRALVAAQRLTVAPGILDPMSACIVERLGFECLYLGGNALGTHLGVGQPFVTMTETADAVCRITRAVHLPLVVDAAAGFGDAAHVRRTVIELEHAGAAAIHIDDQCYPKRAHYHKGVAVLATADVMIGKIVAAVEARRDPAFSIWARTDAFRVAGSIEHVADRARAYARAGADGVVVLDVGPQEIAAVREAVPSLPLVYIGGIKEPVPTAEQLQQAGFSAALYPFNTAAAVANAVSRTWKDFANAGRPHRPDVPTTQTVADMLRLVDMETYWAIEERTTQREARTSE